MKTDRERATQGCRFFEARDTQGFTLLELLVVIAIMSVLAGGIGLYRMNQAPSSRLDTAVRMVSGLVTRARNQAQVSGTVTRVLIDVDSDSPGYLKRFFVCKSSAGDWHVLGNSTELPRGIGVVPRDSSLLQGNWSDASSRFSDLDTRMNFNPDGRGSRQFMYIQFSPDGAVEMFQQSDYLQADVDVDAQLPRIILSTMNRRAANEWVFEHPELRATVFLTVNGDPIVLSN